MLSDGPPDIIEKVGPAHEPLDADERERLENIRNQAAKGGLFLIQELNAMGVQVDAGMEAMAYFRQYLVWIGVITPDQRLVAETLWEVEFHAQLRASVRKVREINGPGNALVTPPAGLMGPDGRPL